LASLAKAYSHELPPKSSIKTTDPVGGQCDVSERWSLDPETMSRKRRDSITAAAGVGSQSQSQGHPEKAPLESWKWATGKDQL
jgi:hypothetical protein